VIEDGKGGSRSPSPYGRANVVTPSFEGGEEESDEYYDDNNSTANLQYAAYNRARSTEYRQDLSLGLMDLVATLQLEAVQWKGVVKVHTRVGLVV